MSLVSDNEIIWFYSIFNCNFKGETAGILAKYLDGSWLAGKGRSSPENRFGMSREQWNRILDKLRTDFDSDIEQIQKNCSPQEIDEGMLRYRLLPDKKKRHLCTYYQFYSARGRERDLLKGSAFFRKTFKL